MCPLEYNQQTSNELVSLVTQDLLPLLLVAYPDFFSSVEIPSSTLSTCSLGKIDFTPLLQGWNGHVTESWPVGNILLALVVSSPFCLNQPIK